MTPSLPSVSSLAPIAPLGIASPSVSAHTIVSPRDPASGLPTGKRNSGIIAVLIG